MTCKIALIGMMGCGKTTISKELSSKLNCPLFDCDDIFEKKYEIKIAEFFKLFGEKEFRKSENLILKEIILNQKFIISTGGGIILSKENRDILFNNEIKTFYLKTNAQTIYNRICNDKSRPLLMVDNPSDEIEKLIKKRERFYNCAHRIIDCDNKDIKTIVKEIAADYGKN